MTRTGWPPCADDAPRVVPSLAFPRRDLLELPAPVRRYFDFALSPGQPAIGRAEFGQVGEFALRPGAWRPMKATEVVTVEPRGFVWDASIRLLPGIAFRVRDTYRAGNAGLRVALAGVVPVERRRNTSGLAAGALLRWLAEAPLVPTALLPAEGVRWSPVEARSARAEVTDAGLTVAMDVHFGDRGEIDRITAMRFRDVGGTGVLTRFIGRWWDYRRISGMMVPTRGEAAWMLPGGPHPFWRAEIRGARYTAADAAQGSAATMEVT